MGAVDRGTPLLETRDVVKEFPVTRHVLPRLRWDRHGVRLDRGMIRAVDGVSLAIQRGETLSLVGESGCGKSTVARLLLRLIKPTRGEIRFQGGDLWALSRREMLGVRKHLQMVFQNPYGSLNPRMKVFDIVAEPLKVHGINSEADRSGGRRRAQSLRERVCEVMEECGLDARYGSRYPHEFSGGQQQRIAIARALVIRPDCVVLDEPVSALDVSVQAQIVNLLLAMQERLGLSYVFISHDLSVVRHVSARVAVMYLGSLCEVGSAAGVFTEPRHHYTRALLRAVPDIASRGRRRLPLVGELPNAVAPPRGCSFHPRCPAARETCRVEKPQPREVSPGHWCACHYPADR
jgi:oligopeptide/dipeptide ABC transporter ATP-binding protein